MPQPKKTKLAPSIVSGCLEFLQGTLISPKKLDCTILKPYNEIVQKKASKRDPLLEIAELGLKGDKSAILSLLQKLAIEEISKKRPASYNKIVDVIEQYASTPATLSSLEESVTSNEGFTFDLKNIWLPSGIQEKIDRFINLHKGGNPLLSKVGHLNKLLLFGPPGSGKTTLGFYIAKKLNKSVTYAKVSDLISSRLGETMKNISDLFRQSQSSVIFIDEFDAFAKKRTDGNDVGELKRVVSSIIQTLDFNAQGKIIIVSTNLLDTLDTAIVRRFGFKIHMDFLDEEEVVTFLNYLLSNESRVTIDLADEDLLFLSKMVSFLRLRTVDEIRLFLDKSVVSVVLSERDVLLIDDFIATVFSEDYINHQNIKALKNSDKKTLASLARFLENKGLSRVAISKLMGIHRNSYNTYAKEI